MHVTLKTLKLKIRKDNHNRRRFDSDPGTAAGQAAVEEAGGSVLEAENNESLSYNKEKLLNPWFLVRKRGLKRFERQ